MAAEESEAPQNALTLDWTFGFNRKLLNGVCSLSDDSRNAIFYTSAHTGVLYDYVHRRQRLLQGHCNTITAVCVSDDKRWVATADAGADSMIVVWDSLTGTPIKTIFQPHPNGVSAMDLSPDAMFLVTLSAVDPDSDDPQVISLWEWTVERDGPLYSAEITALDEQYSVRFNRNDIREIVTNGAERVIFWNWQEPKLKYYSPPITKRDFRQAVARFTQSVFLPLRQQAVTGTEDGDLVLWEPSAPEPGDAGRPTDRRAVKIIRLSGRGAIRVLRLTRDYLVTGSDGGIVRFYDHHFRIVAWFEDLDAGPISSLSFANTTLSDGEPPSSFWVPDFVVGTQNALVLGAEARMFDELVPERRRGTLLMQGMDGSIHDALTHPRLPHLYIAISSGVLQVWDHHDKKLVNMRIFDPAKLNPQCMALDSSGRTLAIGFANGIVKLLDAATLEDIGSSFRASSEAVTKLAFSYRGVFLAAATMDCHVALYRFMIGPDAEPDADPAWFYVGRHHSHSRAITGLQFTVNAAGVDVLISVGEDRMLVEYDLLNSSVAGGVVLKAPPVRLEQSAVPTACMWHPVLPGSKEDLIITTNDEYKFKLWNASNKTCRRTVLAPTFGGPLSKLVRLNSGASRRDGAAAPAGGEGAGEGGEEDGSSGGGGGRGGGVAGTDSASSEYLAYATHDKVIGLVQFPLDGNPARTMGLIAHPGEITALAVTADGRHVLTGGGDDQAVNMWSVETAAVARAVSDAGFGVDPFLELLEGGRGGSFYEEIVDYFYYAQVKSQGEDSTARRRVEGLVPLEEIPNLMRALGYYPSEMEVTNMCSEVKYSTFTTTGEYCDRVTLPLFIMLYVNHRPVFGVGKSHIEEAFDLLGATPSTGAMPWEALKALLLSRGEAMSEDELRACLQALVGEAAIDVPELSGLEFADAVLGFEDYDAPAAMADEGGEADMRVDAAVGSGDTLTMSRFSM
eukprot:PLAT6795.1.p2 GENE.PLAT6795.1~~PLAT6795.1.p2  ORF type:complete len:975 (+),score=426.58 PLAT6795.1:45-2927(+)